MPPSSSGSPVGFGTQSPQSQCLLQALGDVDEVLGGSPTSEGELSGT